MDFFSKVEHCQLYGHPWLVLTEDIGNLVVFGAYLAIPVAILIVMARREMKIHKFKLSLLFAAFIVMCGVGHLVDILTLHFGVSLPWLQTVDAFETIITGIVSAVTVWYCFHLIPTICKLPTYDEHMLIRKVLASYQETEFWDKFTKDMMETERGHGLTEPIRLP